MSIASGTVTFRDYRNAVEGQMRAGFTFGQVEDFINACAIGEEEKTALWLRAWRRQPGTVRRTFVDAGVLGYAARLAASQERADRKRRIRSHP